MYIEFPRISKEELAKQPIWVFGPREGKAWVFFTDKEPIGEDLDLIKIPNVLMSAESCRHIAYLLNQAADVIEGKAFNISVSGYAIEKSLVREENFPASGNHYFVIDSTE